MGSIVDLVWDYVKKNPGCTSADILKFYPKENKSAVRSALRSLARCKCITRTMTYQVFEYEKFSRGCNAYVYEDNS